MATAADARSFRNRQFVMWGFLVVQIVRIWLDRKWPDSLASQIALWVMGTYFICWFGYMVWTGYRRRLPYWTPESWRRYLRLTAMPVAVIVLFFVSVFLFDTDLYSKETFRLVFGQANSALRMAWVIIDLTLMVVGATGLVAAIDWLNRGEASEQFTRTRWFRRGSGSAIA